MKDLSWAVASGGGAALSLGDWLAHLKRRGRLVPLLREAALEQFLLERVRLAGLAASPEELQQAADAFRRSHGLTSAEQTQAWLTRQRLSLLDFEDALERDLLIEKLKDHVTRERIPRHFTAHQAAFARARLRLIVVPREDLARELLSQIRDEGRDFAELAREHSLHPSRADGGRLAPVMRRQLPPAAAQAVFAAREGDVVGPLTAPEGFQLFLVEKLVPAELDAGLAAAIRQELFDAWLAEQLAGARMEFPLLEAL